MSLLIRRYQKDDYKAVFKLHVEGLKQFNASIGDPYLDKDMENIEDTYIHNDGEFLVGLLDERVVSMGAYRKQDSETAEIKRIRIDQNFQRRGLGQKILNALEESAKARGYKKTILDTTINQVPAQKLFHKNGYMERNRKKIQGLEIIFYEKKLEE